MKKILTLAFALMMILQLAAAALAFSPPLPVPIKMVLVMGGEPVASQEVRVEIVDSQDGHVHDSAIVTTDNAPSAKGVLFFDLSSFNGCRGPSPDYPDYTIEGKCYSLPMRGYSGDNLRFTFAYLGLTYSKEFALADVMVRVGVASTTEISFPNAPVLVSVIPVVPVVPVEPTPLVTNYVCSDGSVAVSVSDCPTVPPVVEPVYKCADGTVVESLDECPLTKTNAAAILAGAGIGGGVALAFAALVAYYWRKNKRERARKMLATFFKKKKK